MKKEKRTFKEWWRAHKPTKRRLIQLYAALLVNANIKGFFKGRIYTGASKNFCVPGLNCYSCPGAVGACPLGSLQNALASSGTRAPFYVFGILILFGLLLGRTICGFLCPIGLCQELLYKIKTPKLRKSRFTRLLSYLKYVILAVFVVAIPLAYSAQMTAVPAFCKYICPAGTFGGAIFLLLHPANADLYAMLGPIFTWKFCLLVAIAVLCVFIFRAFCRFLCPLGALYGFFNKIAMLGVKLDKNKCTDCGLCVSHCKMDIKHVGDHECINCGECMDVCPAKAISWKGSKLFVHKNAVEPCAETASPLPPPSDERPLVFPLAKEQAMNEQNEQKPPLSEENPAHGIPALTENEAPMSENKALEEASSRKQKRQLGRNFWLQAVAWGLALVVLAGALIYYNFIFRDDEAVDTPPPVIDPDTGNDEGHGNTVGTLCYDFSLETYGGKGIFTLSEHRGEIVVVNCWYTTCTPCVAEMPYLNKLAEEYEITVVAIHSALLTTNPATREGVEAWLADKTDIFDTDRVWKDYSITFAQDTGKGLSTSDTFAKLGGKNLYPMTLLIDREGKILYTRQGSITYDGLKAELDKAGAALR